MKSLYESVLLLKRRLRYVAPLTRCDDKRISLCRSSGPDLFSFTWHTCTNHPFERAQTRSRFCLGIFRCSALPVSLEMAAVVTRARGGGDSVSTTLHLWPNTVSVPSAVGQKLIPSSRDQHGYRP